MGAAEEPGGMDEMLLKVIIMLLAVAFLKFMLTSSLGNLSWAVLVVPLTIIALALGLRWMQAGAEKTDLLPSPPESAPAQEAYLLVAPYWNSARPFPQFR